MIGISVLLLCGTAVYELRYSLWEMPYDWKEIESSGRIRVAAIEGDTVFLGHVSRFAEEKNLSVEVRYCSHNDELWFRLAAYEVDLVRFQNDRKEYSWKARPNSPDLQDSVDIWYDRNVRHISRFDVYFRQYGDSIGWDWKLLAAVGYVETRFKNINSATGLGVMQLSRRTASHFGAKGSKVKVPHYNIQAAANYIAYLDERFSMVSSRSERTKFVIAAYNSGETNIRKAMAVARQHKKNDCEWADVQKYFRNRHSKRYLRKTLSKYNEYCMKE